jgi:hypothetical protein
MPKHVFLSPRQTGRADFPHPAFTQTLAARQYVSLNANFAGRPSLDLRCGLFPNLAAGSR